MRPDILVISKLAPGFLAQLGDQYTVHHTVEDAADLIRAVVGGGSMVVDRSLIESLPALQIIAVHGVGHDNIDMAAAEERGIAVTFTPDVLTNDVADLAIGLMLTALRNLTVNDHAVRSGGWAVPLSRRVSGRRIGIYGMGQIGQAIARRVAPMTENVAYTARHRNDDLPWRFVDDVATLAEQSDVLILAVPAVPETRGVIDAGVLERLGPEGVLVNIARGSIVDQPALIAALEHGIIRGAGLDVFADEPHVPMALRSLQNAVLSPHQGSATIEGRQAMEVLVLANLAQVLGAT